LFVIIELVVKGGFKGNLMLDFINVMLIDMFYGYATKWYGMLRGTNGQG